MMEMRLIFMALICLVIAQLAFATDYNFTFKTPQEEQRFIKITKQIRCAVCKTQSLFESETTQAAQMRQQIYDMLTSGMAPEQILNSFRLQYGDAILFMPPWRLNTFLLWSGPIIMLGVAGAAVRWRIRRSELKYAC